MSEIRLREKNVVLIGCLALLTLCIASGCKENLIKYEDFIEKPFAIKKGELIKINLGYTRASANWVTAYSRIAADVVYLSGELTFTQIPQVLSIRLPNSDKTYRIFWIDGDGKKTEIAIRHPY